MVGQAVKHPFFALSLLALLLALAAVIALDLPTFWNRVVLYGLEMQRDLHRDLAAAMRALQSSEDAAFWGLVSLGLLYGAFHAIGPGHGKVVISTYLATHESRLARGIALSLLSSLVQGLTAILLVGCVAFVAERSMRESQSLGVWLEVLSYSLVILIGFFLILRGVRRLRHAKPHQGDDGSTCCHHSHGPSAEQLEAPLSTRELVAIILSIGIRPCSGAILVLVLAFAMQQVTAGIAAVAAMSIGTGLSISALAALSVYARKGALALASTFDGEGFGIARLFDLAAIIGGLMIAAFGFALLKAALSVSQHPLL